MSISRFVNNKFRAILEYITSNSGPLGEVLHYVWPREYQSRGMQHFHMFLWVKNAPMIGQSTIVEVAIFINKYVT